MTGGAAVTVITKSGTNELRGSRVRNARQQRLAGVHLGRESRRRHREAERAAEHRRRQASAGRSRRTSCSSSRTGKARSSASNNSVLFSVPTADFRGGDFNRMLGAPILNAAGNPDSGAHHRGRFVAASGRDGLRSVLRQPGRHRPLSIFQRRAAQRHPAGALERADDEDAGTGASPEPAWRYRQLLQFRHPAPEPQQHRRQGQLEPERAASALVQVQRHGRAGPWRLQPRRRRRRMPVRRRRSWRRLDPRADRGHRADLHRLANLPD